MSQTPHFSVIIPTFNRASLLGRAVDSVLRQTYTDYEIIIVDDGSTDETSAILEEYGRQNADVVRSFRQENKGKSIAINEALAKARGEWIAFLDSDDYWDERKLDLQVKAIRKYGDTYGACFTDARYLNNEHLKMTAFEYSAWNYDTGSGVIPDAVDLILIGNHGVYMQTMIVRADLVQQAGLFDPKLRVCHDTDFFFHLARLTRFCYVNQPAVFIDRTMNRSVGLIETLLQDRPRLEERQYMYEKWLPFSLNLGVDNRQTILKRLQEVHSDWANWHLKAERYPEAHRELRTAAHFEVTLKVVAKFAISMIVPGLVRKILLQRESQRAGKQVLV